MQIWTLEQQAGHRKLLVAALRSGEYEQARERLIAEVVTYDPVSGDQVPMGKVGYCCLGVGCVVAAQNGLQGLMVDIQDLNGLVYAPSEDPDDIAAGIETQEYDGEPPMMLMDFYGFTDSCGGLKAPWDIEEKRWLGPDERHRGNTATSLVSLNDDARLTFDQIADAIEQGRVLVRD